MTEPDKTLPELEPAEGFAFERTGGGVLLIACGAVAREIVDLIEANRWQGFDIQCLPAIWHNTPDKIPDGVRRLIREARGKYRSIYVVYGDCGTGGLLDRVLDEEGVERIEGPHCYAFFTGVDRFGDTAEEDVTAFYLTDYLARHFDKLVWEGLGIAKHPELLPLYFGNYTKLVYLAQTDDAGLRTKAQAAAEKLGLAYEERRTGYGDLATALKKRA
ncbi:MAG: DUF1638 domain-containing protein [Hyphomicrobiales bacterium]